MKPITFFLLLLAIGCNKADAQQLDTMYLHMADSCLDSAVKYNDLFRADLKEGDSAIAVMEGILANIYIGDYKKYIKKHFECNRDAMINLMNAEKAVGLKVDSVLYKKYVYYLKNLDSN